MSDFIDKIQKQCKQLGYIDIVVDSKTYEKQLPEKWFHVTAKAGIEVTVSDVYGADFSDHIGFVILEDNEVIWLKIWD